MASAFALRLRARWLSSGPADSQPVASHTRNHMMLLTCERTCCCVSACASLARLACVQRACRACCARVCSCAKRRAASVGEACEAKPGARHAYWRRLEFSTFAKFVPEACLKAVKTEIDATIRRGAQISARRLLLRSPAAALRHLSSKGRRNGHIESRTKTTLRNTEEQ